MTDTALLEIWTDTEHMATVGYRSRDDYWQFAYTPAWCGKADSFPVCPSLPLPRGGQPTEPAHAGVIRRFLENLLPEGRALDTITASRHIAKTNIFALVRLIGAEATGAFRFLPPGQPQASAASQAPRFIPLQELSERIATQKTRPLIEWDGKIRMSVAGFQEKLPVYLHDATDPPWLFLPDGPLASTHILKPEPAGIEHLVINEHYCMSLAKAMGLPVADVYILRVPQPVLSVKRFDRAAAPEDAPGIAVSGIPGMAHLRPIRRLHIIDACQAFDFPVSLKYERNFGNGRDVAHIRDGMSLPRLFRIARQHGTAPALAARELLQWALFQLLIGNYDAHGKNFSFFATAEGLRPAPWYDLVSVAQYPDFVQEYAMGIGDAFAPADITALELAQFATSCGIPASVLSREAKRLAVLADKVAKPLPGVLPYTAQERDYAQSIADHVVRQSRWLEQLARQAVQVNADLLMPYAD